MPSLVVLGAKNLGGAVLDRFAAAGWSTAGVARSEETVSAIEARAAHAIRADATDPAGLAAALTAARSALGGLDAVVNALSVAAPAPGEPWGGGPIADATIETWERWSAAISRMAFVFLSEGARALRESGGGTLVQISNPAARRSLPGQGALAAGHQALAALVRSAAQELRPEGIRACLLIANGAIWSPKNAARIEADGLTQADVLDMGAIADTVLTLATQPPGGMQYEVVLSAVGLPWHP